MATIRLIEWLSDHTCESPYLFEDEKPLGPIPADVKSSMRQGKVSSSYKQGQKTRVSVLKEEIGRWEFLDVASGQDISVPADKFKFLD